MKPMALLNLWTAGLMVGAVALPGCSDDDDDSSANDDDTTTSDDDDNDDIVDDDDDTQPGCPLSEDACGTFERVITPPDNPESCRCCPFFPAQYNHYETCPLTVADCPTGTHLMLAESPDCYCLHDCVRNPGECLPETADMEEGVWRMFGQNYRNTRSNPFETLVGAGNVHRLVRQWQAIGPMSTSTPAVVNGVVYYGDWAGNFYARNVADGAVVWQAALGGGVHPSPFVADDAIYIPQSRRLHALDRMTGEVLWVTDVADHPTGNVDSSPVVVDDYLVMGVNCGEIGSPPPYTCRGNIVGLDRRTGGILWRYYVTDDDACSGAGVSVWSSAAIDPARHLMYIGTGNTYEFPAAPMSDGILALDYRTGERRWVRQFTVDDVYTLFQTPPQGPDADTGAAPNLFTVGGRDWVGVGDKNGVYTVLDRDTGRLIWTRKLTPGSHLGGIMQAAAYHDGVIYVGSNFWPAGVDTSQIWVPDFNNPCNLTRVFALDAATGESRWEVDLQYPTIGGMLVANGVVYIGVTLGKVYALDARDGRVLWMDQVGDSLASGRTLIDGRLFVTYGFSFVGIVSDEPGSQAGGLVVYGLADEPTEACLLTDGDCDPDEALANPKSPLCECVEWMCPLDPFSCGVEERFVVTDPTAAPDPRFEDKCQCCPILIGPHFEPNP